jgi:3-phosphoglycerate kinase
LFIGGKIATEYSCDNEEKNIHVMKDGYGNISLGFFYRYIDDIKNTNLNVYDIGDNSLNTLFDLIKENEIIFWNGSLGVIEHQYYIQGSLRLIDFLKKQKDKIIIIGGGDTSTLIDKNGNIYVSTGGGALLEILENLSKNNGYLIGIDIFRENIV